MNRQRAARAVLALVLLGLFALLVVGLAMVWGERGPITALAIFPGMPLGAVLLTWLIYRAFDE